MTGRNTGTGNGTDGNAAKQFRGRVVTLGDRQRLTARVLGGLRNYWDAKRDGDRIPMRTDIDPRGLGDGLAFCFVLERVAPGMGRFRVAGEHLNDLMGMEVRGMPLTAFFAAPARAQITEATETVFAGPAALTASLIGETGYGRPALSARMLMLPLCSDLGDVNRILGCIVSDGDIGRKPRRFSLLSLETEYLSTGKEAPSGHPTPHLSQAGFAEDATPFTPQAQTPEARRKLFRIVSRKD